MTAEQLRQALDRQQPYRSGDLRVILDAARCWLRLQEGGAIIIEPYEHEGRQFWPVWAHLPELGAGGISTEQLDALASAQENQT